MRVAMNSMSLLLFMPHRKFDLFFDIFSSAIDERLSFNKITPVEKMHKWGEIGFFKKA
jgi:hypothetical protein